MLTLSEDLVIRNACMALGNAAFHSNMLYAQLQRTNVVSRLTRVLQVSAEALVVLSRAVVKVDMSWDGRVVG